MKRVTNSDLEGSDTSTSLLDPAFVATLQRLAFRIKGRVRGDRRGERRSRAKGHGGDFADARPYAAGDDLRHLDWHAYARLDALYIKVYEELREHGLHLLLDTSASMGCGKSVAASQLAAALGYLALTNMDSAGVYLLRDALVGVLGPLRGTHASHRLLTFLDAAVFAGATDLHRGVEAFVGTQPRGSVVLVSDFLVREGRREALESLARAKARTVVVHLLSPDERDPPLERELQLVDSETGRELALTVTPGLKSAYLQRLDSLTDELRTTCRRFGMTFVEASTDTSLEGLLLGEGANPGVLEALAEAKATPTALAASSRRR